ncbi:hypothetical protein ANCCAN_30616 [Ancylostoma caninum]|uniref:Uncharacterized protein n=1 Tax=Ancylostoma caninum TaxID=29170 RepID=A0A368F0I2_ANCCA|nr:hypothetical protein ANCCAN_30616 [Ancylostoma caninum]
MTQKSEHSGGFEDHAIRISWNNTFKRLTEGYEKPPRRAIAIWSSGSSSP